MNAIEKAVRNENATILSRHVNEFPGVEKAAGGFTGMFVLSESHASVHTWPEYSLATIDIYMCGTCNAFACIDTIIEELERADFRPSNKVETRISRGQVSW
jgi:S-adenosylmethionine decarboxylase